MADVQEKKGESSPLKSDIIVPIPVRCTFQDCVHNATAKCGRCSKVLCIKHLFTAPEGGPSVCLTCRKFVVDSHRTATKIQIFGCFLPLIIGFIVTLIVIAVTR